MCNVGCVISIHHVYFLNFLAHWFSDFITNGLFFCAAGIYAGKARGVSDTAEKLANMSIGSGRVARVRQPLPRAPMKAGGWNGQSDLFMGRSQEMQQPGRPPFTRKVAG